MKIKEFFKSHGWINDGDVFAHDKNGNVTHACLYGAISICYRDADSFLSVAKQIREEIKSDSIGHWNDRSTFEEVMALVEKLDV